MPRISSAFLTRKSECSQSDEIETTPCSPPIIFPASSFSTHILNTEKRKKLKETEYYALKLFSRPISRGSTTWLVHKQLYYVGLVKVCLRDPI